MNMSLFEDPRKPSKPDSQSPLAERMRPETLDEYVGQEHIFGAGKPLRLQLERDQLNSMILWGPPGVGKTTLARLIAKSTRCDFVPFSAVMSGIKEIKTVLTSAERNRGAGRRTVLFVDEIHRFNKAQQDAFLPYVERGDIILIGATTENPSFEVIPALLSRSKVYGLTALGVSNIVRLLRRALEDSQRGLGSLKVVAGDELLEQIAVYSSGDARLAYNLLDLAAGAAVAQEKHELTTQIVEDLLQRKVLLYDKGGEEHFNLVSALHKSVRSSDADAALYWLGRMLESGEDRLYLARRLIRMAIEDIGLADPRALEQAIAGMQCFHFLGTPEGDLALAQVTLYLSLAPKSDASYKALQAVQAEIQAGTAHPVPMQLRNAPTKHMKQWGYGKDYEHAHAQEDALTAMDCLPEELLGKRFYYPTSRGVEARLSERLAEIDRNKGTSKGKVKVP